MAGVPDMEAERAAPIVPLEVRSEKRSGAGVSVSGGVSLAALVVLPTSCIVVWSCPTTPQAVSHSPRQCESTRRVSATVDCRVGRGAERRW